MRRYRSQLDGPPPNYTRLLVWGGMFVFAVWGWWAFFDALARGA